ncbi:coiled-coil domain-containing protein 83 [Rhinichthys klamathensis goyatoka]|uniref:coiled-coil domain-containing protein 83 n=1 Tax=Rhinichthys klamathensis goyatoka TaxID=3034132 RepID=UPI0024B48B88|nr:coiled-coil domain-containing protein 83 [Rhinichthys klamathensis goyatoka]
MSKTLDITSLAEAFIQFQIQVKKKEIQDSKDEMCQLEDKNQKLIKLQEQLRVEKTRHVRELNKQIKERERNLEQRQREDEEQVKQTTQENLELKQEQEKHLEELRCKLARLQVQVEELQTDRQEWLQYKNEGSIKDHQKIEKLEKNIAFTQMIFQELSEHFQKSLAAAVEKDKQMEAQSIKDINQLALKVPLYINRVAVLESTIQQLEKENLEHIDNLFQILCMDDPLVSQDDEFLAQSASVGSHDTRSTDRNITKISLEETSALVNRPPYSLQPLAEEAQQERDATACDGTTPSTPPDLSEMYSSQTTFTRAMHLDLMGRILLCVIGKASTLHPPPNNPVDVSEEMTFDLLQTAKWPITTKIINRKFQESASQSAEYDASVYNTCEIQKLLDN